MLLNKQTPLPTEILLLIARLLDPWDLINLAIAIPGLDRQYKPKYWISIKDEHGNTALHICAANQLDNFITSLLERQFDLSLTNQLGYTALHSACQYGHESSARLLLDAPSSCGLDPNAAAIGGTTALHLAIKAGTLSTIQLLLDRGADILARSSGGYTALHWAVDLGHDHVVELLLSSGMEDILSVQDDLGRTTLHLAAWLGRGEVVERLLTAGADSGIRDRDGYTPADLAGQSIQGLRKLENPIIQFVSSIYTFVYRTIRRG